MNRNELARFRTSRGYCRNHPIDVEGPRRVLRASKTNAPLDPASKQFCTDCLLRQRAIDKQSWRKRHGKAADESDVNDAESRKTPPPEIINEIKEKFILPTIGSHREKARRIYAERRELYSKLETPQTSYRVAYGETDLCWRCGGKEWRLSGKSAGAACLNKVAAKMAQIRQGRK